MNNFLCIPSHNVLDLTQNQKLDIFLDAVFNKFDVDGSGKVTVENFKSVVSVEPQLLEIFDYFNQGIIDSVQPGTELDQKDLHIIDDLENLHSRLNQLKEYIEAKQETTSEVYRDPQSHSQVKELKRTKINIKACHSIMPLRNLKRIRVQFSRHILILIKILHLTVFLNQREKLKY